VKVLLDECIYRRLAKALKGHAVRTVPQMGWATIKTFPTFKPGQAALLKGNGQRRGIQF
jgi:hypothetical protein